MTRTSGQNVVASTSWETCVCGFEGLTETFADYETHVISWTCPVCDRDCSEWFGDSLWMT